MRQRKRLFRANKRPLDSFEEDELIQSSQSNVLDSIKNHNLYLKLVAIALQLSKQAGVTSATLQQVQDRLLEAKGLQQYPMLNQKKEKQINQVDDANENNSYGSAKKFITPEEQLSFLTCMNKQVQEMQARENVIYALKKFIQKKKGFTNEATEKQKSFNRAHIFAQKARSKAQQKRIQKSTLYGKQLKQIISRIQPEKSLSLQILKKMIHLKTMWGHTFFSEAEEQYCPVYNAIFDKTEQLIITGGQDGKIKAWSKGTGALISTLQGHKQYINKISVTSDNKIILSAAQDGVRFFDLENMNSMGGYQIQSIMDIGQVIDKNKKSFIIFANGEKLYVISLQDIRLKRNRKLEVYDFQVYNFKQKLAENTGNVNTMTITSEGLVFLGFIEGQLILFDFNKLGQAKIDENNFGTAEGMSKIQQLQLPIICVLNAHQGDILQIKWNPVLQCFSTGAKKDGVCKIWQFKLSQPNRKPQVVRQLKIPKYKMKRKKKQYNCNFGCWNSSYTHITCSFQEQQLQQQTQNRGDGQVVVYNAKRMQVTWQMSKSIDLSSIRAMDSHPYLPNIAVICDSFGKVIIVDIFQNYIVNLFQERAFHLGHPSFCLVPSQCRFSQDGLTLLVATEYGNISLYGYDIKSFYQIYPTQQIFKNDYQQFRIDPITYKPILHEQIPTQPIDINNLNYGQLQNMKHIAYRNIRPINARKFVKETNQQKNKQEHQNVWQIDLQRVEIVELLQNDFQKSNQIFRQNVEQIQNKRMTILYEQGQSRQARIKQLINQKVQKMRQVDQNMPINLFNQTITSQNNSLYNSYNNSHQFNASNQNTVSNGYATEVRRRGRRATRNTEARTNTRAIRRNYNEFQNQNLLDADENLEQNNNQEQQQYQAQFQSQEEQNHSFDDDGDDQFQQNQSGDLYNQHANRRSRRRQRIQRNLRRNNHYHENHHQPRRPARVAIQQLQQGYEQHFGRVSRRRSPLQINQNSQQNHNQEQQQSKKQLRRVANRTLTQIRSQRNYCNLCQFKPSTVQCSSCHEKYFCDNCKNCRGHKTSGHNSQYTCFECIYLNNVEPERIKNISYEKYINTTRLKEPFIPQIGDEVVYFFQGYEQFLNDKIQILNNKFKQLGMNFDIVPHEKSPELINIQKCQVIDIHYAFPLQQSYQISYKQQSNARGRGRQQRQSSIQDILMLVSLKTISGIEFKVFFTAGCQFILKSQIYDDIMLNERYGKFKLYDIAFLKGEEIQISQVKVLDPMYGNSIWKNIVVHKSETKFLRRNKDKGEQIAVNIWNLDGFIDQKAFDYKVNFDNSLKQNYKEEIRKIQRNQPEMWSIFGQAVDTEIFPEYPKRVEISMYLELILERLQNNYYASEKSFIKDMNTLIENSIIFNGKDCFITQMAQKLVKLVLEGQNYNNSNQQQISTQKKTKTKRKLNSGGSSGVNKDQQIDKNRRNKQVRVSKFEEDHQHTLKRLKRNRKIVQQASNDDYVEEQSEQKFQYKLDSSDQIVRPATRNRRKTRNNQQVVGNGVRKQNGRVTRSRTKN